MFSSYMERYSGKAHKETRPTEKVARACHRASPALLAI